MDRLSESIPGRVPEILFGILLVVSVIVLAEAGAGLTFFYDEWQIVLAQGSLGHALLEPHNGQVFLVPTAVYRLLMEVFGIGSQLPYRLVALAVASCCAATFFVTTRRSAGGWMALVLILPVLFLGSAWEALLLPLSMNFLISLAAGLSAMLLLEREDRTGDVGGCALLAMALASGGLGLAFLAGAIVSVLLRGELKRLWIVALPLLLMLVWTLQDGGQATSSVTMANVKALPDYVYHAALAVVGSTTGISMAWPSTASWAQGAEKALLYLILAAVALRIFLVQAPISKRALTLAAVLLAFWVLAGLATGVGREPQASRYQYPGVILALATGAALLEGLFLPRLLPLFCLPVAAFSLIPNLSLLDSGREFLGEQTIITRSVLGALEAGHAGDPPGLNAGSISGDRYLIFVSAGPYFDAIGRHGSPAYDPVQIRSAPPLAAAAALRTSTAIQAIRRTYEKLNPASATSSPRPACRRSTMADPRSEPGSAEVNRGHAG